MNWLSRLEQSSEAHANRFRSSRPLARDGRVQDVEIRPGHAHAKVVDRRGEVHEVDISVRQLSDGEKDDLVSAIADRAASLAAVLAGSIPEGLLDELAELEIDVLPSAADMRPDCSCEEYAEPCVHAGALLVVLEQLFARDPFTLFELRGLPRVELLGRIRARRRAGAEGAAAGSAGAQSGNGDMSAPSPARSTSDPWGSWTVRRTLGEPPRVTPGNRMEENDPGEWVQFRPTPSVSRQRDAGSVFDELRRDASLRATLMLSEGAPSMVEADFRVDLARLVANGDWQGRQHEAARAVGLSPDQLAALVDAFRLGGAEAVIALDDSSTWSVDQDLLGAARDELVDLGFERRSVSLNYNSLGIGRGHLLVRGRTGHWYLIAVARPRRAQHLVLGPLDRPGELGPPGNLHLE